MTNNEFELEKMFDELYPAEGARKSLASEIVYAILQLDYCEWQDGYHIGLGHGKKVCNPSARFLMSYTTEEIANLIIAAWGLENPGAYCALLDVIIGKVLEYLKAHPELKDMDTDGVPSCKDPIEDTDEYDLRDASFDFDDDYDVDDKSLYTDEILNALNSNAVWDGYGDKALQDLLDADKRILMDECIQG